MASVSGVVEANQFVASRFLQDGSTIVKQGIFKVPPTVSIDRFIFRVLEIPSAMRAWTGVEMDEEYPFSPEEGAILYGFLIKMYEGRNTLSKNPDEPFLIEYRNASEEEGAAFIIRHRDVITKKHRTFVAFVNPNQPIIDRGIFTEENPQQGGIPVLDFTAETQLRREA